MELRYRSSRLNKPTVLAKTLPYLALASLIGCGIPGEDRGEVGRFLHREQFTDQYLRGCLVGTSWDTGQEIGETRNDYTEYNYNGEPDIVIVHSSLKLPPLVFRAEGDDGALVPDSELTQHQLNIHGC